MYIHKKIRAASRGGPIAKTCHLPPETPDMTDNVTCVQIMRSRDLRRGLHALRSYRMIPCMEQRLTPNKPKKVKLG